MSTTAVTAGQIMDRVANLLNDPSKTDYTYTVQLPYLNMAIEEFSEMLAESNSPFTNLSSSNGMAVPMILPAGSSLLTPPEYPPPFVNYPLDLIEIQEIGERPNGDKGPYIRLPRREFQDIYPQTSSLLYWVFERGAIRFNPPGANVPMDIQIKYLYQGIPYAVSADSVIDVIGSRTYLAYKTAAFCALFIGENESRAKVLEEQANIAVDRAINISNKGKQEIVTRHRPFRASYKSRGGF
jgi:hypothetical protein